tara:strand:+ start:315 stop:524 length:210 start_codon:yes stop_codon:yes gene_type:complete
MAWEKILEEQANVDSPTFIFYQDDGFRGKDHQKIVVKTITPRKTYTMFFHYEEIEDFYFFIEQVYKETA